MSRFKICEFPAASCIWVPSTGTLTLPLPIKVCEIKKMVFDILQRHLNCTLYGFKLVHPHAFRCRDVKPPCKPLCLFVIIHISSQQRNLSLTNMCTTHTSLRFNLFPNKTHDGYFHSKFILPATSSPLHSESGSCLSAAKPFTESQL